MGASTKTCRRCAVSVLQSLGKLLTPSFVGGSSDAVEFGIGVNKLLSLAGMKLIIVELLKLFCRLFIRFELSHSANGAWGLIHTAHLLIDCVCFPSPFLKLMNDSNFVLCSSFEQSDESCPLDVEFYHT